MADTTFTVCIEERGHIVGEVVCQGADAPLLLVDKDGAYFVHIGQYASPGNRHAYRRAVPVSF